MTSCDIQCCWIGRGGSAISCSVIIADEVVLRLLLVIFIIDIPIILLSILIIDGIRSPVS